MNTPANFKPTTPEETSGGCACQRPRHDAAPWKNSTATSPATASRVAQRQGQCPSTDSVEPSGHLRAQQQRAPGPDYSAPRRNWCVPTRWPIEGPGPSPKDRTGAWLLWRQARYYVRRNDQPKGEHTMNTANIQTTPEKGDKHVYYIARRVSYATVVEQGKVLHRYRPGLAWQGGRAAQGGLHRGLECRRSLHHRMIKRAGPRRPCAARVAPDQRHGREDQANHQVLQRMQTEEREHRPLGCHRHAIADQHIGSRLPAATSSATASTASSASITSLATASACWPTRSIMN